MATWDTPNTPLLQSKEHNESEYAFILRKLRTIVTLVGCSIYLCMHIFFSHTHLQLKVLSVHDIYNCWLQKYHNHVIKFGFQEKKQRWFHWKEHHLLEILASWNLIILLSVPHLHLSLGSLFLKILHDQYRLHSSHAKVIVTLSLNVGMNFKILSQTSS
jgi:hypothetical protein